MDVKDGTPMQVTERTKERIWMVSMRGEDAEEEERP